MAASPPVPPTLYKCLPSKRIIYRTGQLTIIVPLHRRRCVLHAGSGTRARVKVFLKLLMSVYCSWLEATNLLLNHNWWTRRFSKKYKYTFSLDTNHKRYPWSYIMIKWNWIYDIFQKTHLLHSYVFAFIYGFT